MLNIWTEKRKLLPQNTFLEIKLEDFVSYPENELRKICNFIEIDFEDTMLSIDLNQLNAGRYTK